MYLEMVPEMRLSQENTIAVLVRAAELLRVLVCLCVPVEFLLTGEALVTTLQQGKKVITYRLENSTNSRQQPA